MDKTGRNGLRIGDITETYFLEKYKTLKQKHLSLLAQFEYDTSELDTMEKTWLAATEELKKLNHIDSEHELNNAMKTGKAVLAEGAQGSLLDIDFGSYPFVTSSNTVCAGACTGLGVAPNRIGEVFGIFKAYCTRVGSGPFPTELFDTDGVLMQKEGNEFGATTGRPRRCGWIDLPALKYACMINGVTQLIMMKADVLSCFDSIKVCTHYNYKGEQISHFPYDVAESLVSPIYIELPGWKTDLTGVTDLDALPIELLSYVEFLEKELELPITIISVGPDRSQTILRDKALA
jgi:adenylosuccinate synthase